MSTVVQRATGYFLTNGGTVTLPSPTTAGNRICIAALHSYLATPPSAASSQGDVLTKHVNNANDGGSAGSNNLHVWTSAPIAAGGGCTITFTFGAGTIREVLVSEVSGLDATTPFETYSVHDSAGSATITAGSVTPTVNASYLVMLANSDGGAYTAGTGFTKQFDTGGYYAGDLIQATAAAINPQATVTGSPTYSHGYVVVFKSDGTGGGGGSAVPIIKAAQRRRFF